MFLGFSKNTIALIKRARSERRRRVFQPILFGSPQDEVDPFPASLIAAATFATAFLRNCHFTINNTISHPFLLTIEIVSDIG